MLRKKANAGAWIGGGLGAVGGYAHDGGSKQNSMSDRIKRAAVGGLGGAALGGLTHAHIKSFGVGNKSGARSGYKGSSGAGSNYKKSSGAGSNYGGNSENKSNSRFDDIREKFRKAQEEAKKKAEEKRKSYSGGTGKTDNNTFNKAKNKFTSEFDGMSDAEAKRHYRQSARKNHPDMGGNEEDFKGLSSAYETFKKRNNL